MAVNTVYTLDAKSEALDLNLGDKEWASYLHFVKLHWPGSIQSPCLPGLMLVSGSLALFVLATSFFTTSAAQ